MIAERPPFYIKGPRTYVSLVDRISYASAPKHLKNDMFKCWYKAEHAQVRMYLGRKHKMSLAKSMWGADIWHSRWGRVAGRWLNKHQRALRRLKPYEVIL